MSAPATPPSTEKVEKTGTAVRALRYGFIDLLRGFALVVMIETHVVNAYLPLALRKGSTFFFWLTFINGLVAPAFLFATGFSLILQGDRQWENWLHFRMPFWRHMRRIGFILLVAYYTHLEGFSLSRYLENWNDYTLWAKSMRVDILQCIVVSLLAVHALIFVLRSKKLLPWGAVLLAIVAALITPWMWAHDFRGKLSLWIALFLNPHGVSLFPIFPWICFVLTGSCAASFFLRSVESGKSFLYMRITALAGTLMIAAGLWLRDVPYTLPGYTNFYNTSPLYVMIRLGCILLICSFLYWLETAGRWVPKSILLAGQESLLVYGVHLWIIFALLRGTMLGPVLGREYGYGVCFVISILIIVFMLYLARQWHALKKKYPDRVRLAQAGIVLAMIAVFILR
jgi:uncharacterized membrane protein